jgi:uncharacterized membrane protein YphA (DoxX/SURF4 family)
MTIWTINLYVLGAAVLLTGFLYQIRKPANLVLELLKNFIGAYFIFSGIVKAIDPAGTGIKMEEYFEIFHQYFPFLSFLWTAFEPVSLEFSIFMILLEIVLGISLIIGTFPRLTAWLLLLIIVFFTFLTGFSHITGKVTDCGCFGDFIKLTPKQSFIKDIVLIFVILPIFIGWKHISPIFPVKPRLLSLFILSLLAAVFTARNVYYEPIIDFRAYQVGVNIPECLSLPPNAKPYIYENIFIYKNKASGEITEFTVDKLPTDYENWEFVDRKDKLIQKGDDPKCKDFAIQDENGSDVTSAYMEEAEPVIAIVISDIRKTNHDGLASFKEIIDAAYKANYYPICLTGSNADQVKAALKKVQINIDVFNTDATPLKTIMRSNPGLLLLKQGTIKAKFHYHNQPDFKQVKAALGL